MVFSACYSKVIMYIYLLIYMKKMVKKVTPLMKQYNAITVKYPDALLLFRVGDFYETFIL